MTELHYTLLSDGSSDRVLMPILTWLLHEHLPNCAVQPHWPELARLRRPLKKLHEKIQAAIDLSPCNLLFVHRDAENASPQDRQKEVDEAVSGACQAVAIPPVIAVVPVRMMEAWLLFDIPAIRRAAGNPNGSVDLDVPRLADVESVPDPKNTLHRAILDATEKGTRRRGRFNVSSAVHRIPQYIDDFTSLRVLSAFTALENRIEEVITEQQWRQ
jgi:hypothetical protein